MINFLSQIKIYDIFDILIISCIIYYIILLIKGTKTIQILKGIFFLFIITFLSQLFHLNTLNWILEKIFAIGIISLVIIFQPELRNLLRKLGTEQILPFSTLHSMQINQILEAVNYLAENKIGSLIVLEKTTPLGVYAKSGCEIDGIIDKRLLISIFYPNNLLHDGAVIIRQNRIASAGCILPINPSSEKDYLGTRHLSAINLSEETDAIVIVTSEETGRISLAQEGKIYEGITIEELRKKIEIAFPQTKE